ncbi:MAG: hypothetical protein DRJ03_02565 [Chloroflexi bacterium]|nr:MAG: hypothetical protein DRJ03_02565 [Chloroflexota bacterium]
MNVSEILSILRNPYGIGEAIQRQARVEGAYLIETQERDLKELRERVLAFKKAMEHILKASTVDY